MSDHDFGPAESAPDFIDPIHGVRAFSLDKMGRLRPWNTMSDQHEHVFTPGENVAKHYGWMLSALPDPLSFLLGRPEPPKKEPPHNPHTCLVCGFYAYTDQQSAQENHVRPFHVAGIVQAYGKVARGPLGFRAEKVRVEALHVPGPPLWLMKAIIGLRPWMLLVVFALCTVVAALGVPFAAVLGGMALGGFMIWKWLRGGMPIGNVLRPKIALYGNYPDVKFYRRRKAMMDHYGIKETPDLPTPEQDEFWTRSA